MVRAFPRVAAWLAVCLLLAAGAARADSLSLVGGGTVNGSFVYDATNNSIVSFDFTTTAGGGFGNESYVGPSVAAGSGGTIVTNQDGDQVFSFVAAQSDGTVDELDIVISCNGVVNCAQQATTGNSFAITSGPNFFGLPSCPNNGTATGYCIPSGLQNQVPGGLSGDLIGPGNYITITDPTCPSTDSCYTFTLATASTGTVFNGGGGGSTGMPEPSTLLLSALGLGGLALKRFYA